MKISKVAAAVFATVGTVLLLGSLVLCFVGLNRPSEAIQPPEEAEACAASLLEAVENGDFDRAAKLLYGAPELGLDREPATAEGKQLWQAYVNSISVTSGAGCYSEGSEVFRTAEITAMDISAVMSQLDSRASELLSKKLEEAEDPTQLLSESGEVPQSLKEEVLAQAFSALLEENTQTVTRQVTLKLVQQDGQWRAVPDKALLDILSGGLG